MITDLDIDNYFEYHAPTEEQIQRMKVIRNAAKALAMAIINNSPRSADQSSAIRHLRNAVMEANASIVLNE